MFVFFQLRKKLIEKSKDGTLKAVTNGDVPKPAPKKRGRWDQTADPGGDVTPAKKPAQDWEKEDVSMKIVKFLLMICIVYIYSYSDHFSRTKYNNIY